MPLRQSFLTLMLVLAMVPHIAEAARTRPEPMPGRPQRTFRCEGDVTFTIVADKHRARITTAGGVYDLRRSRSSIGRKYSSDTVAFIQDEDRAVLVGASGGPFRDCRRVD